MYHTSSYFLSLANVANTGLNAITDDILFIQNNHLVPQKDMFLALAIAHAVTLTRARINNPSLRQVAPSQIRPITASLLPGDKPNVAYYLDSPLKMRGLEEIVIEATDSAVGPNNAYCHLFLLDGPIEPVPQGDIITIRATGTTTVVAQAWTTCQLTFDDSLPVGRYVCVGMTFQGATAVAGRAIFDNQIWRPGVVGTTNLSDRPSDYFLQRELGIMGRFQSTSLPRFQALCNAADTAQTVYFDIIKVG